MHLHGHRLLADGVLLETSEGQICVRVINDSVIHVVYTQQTQFSSKPSLIVLPQPECASGWTVHEHDATISLSTRRLRLDIARDTCAFTWLDAAGNLLVREPRRAGKRLEPVAVEKVVRAARVRTVESVDGATTRAEDVTTTVDRMAYSTKLCFEFSDGEAIYGLGQYEDGILNYRGHSQLLYQQNMKVAIPMIVSTRGYAVLWDCCSLAAFHDDVHGSYFWTDVDDEMDFYVIYGPEFDSIVASYRELTGRLPMLPKWAYGYVQSKERYVTQDELVDVVQEHRRRGIPLDCIVQDWRSWPGKLWGQKSFDPERFPDPDRLTRDLHALGAHLMLSVWPNMTNDGANHVEMRENGFLLANGSTYDAFMPDARALYWKQANEGLFRHGLDAWWCDCTEPFEADWKGKVKPEPHKRVQMQVAEFKKYLDPEYINAYSLLHAQGIYEGQRATTSEKRVLNLTRSGFPGQQRYGTVTWSGDICATWQTLRRQIADGLNFCVTGNPRWTLDIGAFFVGQKEQWFWQGDFPGGCDDEGYRELYVRWFQLGAFLPMFRSHGTDTPREMWRFGEPGSETYDTLLRFDRLRYRLLPYIYSLAAWEVQRGYTMMRNLAFDFRHDRDVYCVDDQFMFGPALLVCPVTTPMRFGPGSTPLNGTPATRRVYLPRGCDWYDFWTGRRYGGGQTIEADAPLATMPLFVRSGAVLPLGPVVQHSAEQRGAPWELRIYPGASSSFDIYEDRGDGYGYEQGEFGWTPVQWSDADSTLTIGARRGRFDGMVEHRVFSVVRVGEQHGVGVDAAPAPDQTIGYHGELIRTSLDGIKTRTEETA